MGTRQHHVWNYDVVVQYGEVRYAPSSTSRVTRIMVQCMESRPTQAAQVLYETSVALFLSLSLSSSRTLGPGSEMHPGNRRISWASRPTAPPPSPCFAPARSSNAFLELKCCLFDEPDLYREAESCSNCCVCLSRLNSLGC
jgi:hypothetical protein